jgi:Ca2+-binding RTX toxin-like protein
LNKIYISCITITSFLLVTLFSIQSLSFIQVWAAVIQCPGDECIGTPQNDVIHGSPSPDSISGLEGRDIISGNAENDDIAGGPDGDTIFGGIEHDEISGGPGNDNIIDVEGDETISGGNGNDFISDNSGRNTLRGDDNINSNDIGNDIVTGGLDIDLIEGGLGKDILNGREENDEISHSFISNTAPDGRQDLINCGPGDDDQVWINQFQDKDIAINCEIVHNELETDNGPTTCEECFEEKLSDISLQNLLGYLSGVGWGLTEFCNALADQEGEGAIELAVELNLKVVSISDSEIQSVIQCLKDIGFIPPPST